MAALAVTPPRIERLAGAGALVTILVALTVLAGWLTGDMRLTAFGTGLPVMPAMAATLLVQGLALVLLLRPAGRRGPPWLAPALGLATAGVGLLFLAENLFRLELGIDLLLFRDQLLALDFVHPGRPTTQILVAIVFDGLALALLDARSRHRPHPAEVFAIAAAVLPTFALLGHLLGASTFYELSSYYPTPPHAAAVRIVFSLAILCARPGRGLMAPLAEEGTAGQLLRRMVPAFALLPIALAVAAHTARRMGLIGPEAGQALVVLLYSALSVGLVGWNGALVRQRDAERAAAEAHRRLLDVRLASLLEASPDAILVVDEASTIVYATAPVADVFGYLPAELVGGPLEVLIPSRVRPAHAALVAAYFRHPNRRPMAAGMNLTGVRKDGTEVPLEISLGPVQTDLGGHVIAMVRDVSERKRVMGELARRNAELVQARELATLKDHFFSTLSHELKTPLSLIVGFAELLEDRYGDDELVTGVADGARRMTEHLTRILDYNALVSGTLALDAALVDPAEVAEHAAAGVAADFEQAGIRLVSALPPEAPVIRADGRRLCEATMELLGNARRFSPMGGVVTLRVGATERDVAITIEDAGSGVPAADRARIWEPFSQLDVGDATRRGGLGLGLALARALVERQGGTVALDDAPGGGARFTIRMPRA